MTQTAAYDLLNQIRLILENELTPITPIDPNDPDVLFKLNNIDSGIASINSYLSQIDISALKGDKGDKGDSAIPAPYGFFDLGSVSIPSANSPFSIPSPLYGDISVSSGNIVLPAGFSYDIDVNVLVDFTSPSFGYFKYRLDSNGFEFPIFQEVASVSSSTGNKDSFPLLISIPKLSSDLTVSLVADDFYYCTSLSKCHIRVRGHYA